MSPERAPFAALDNILRRTRYLLIDFDGPICSLFAGTPTAPVADDLRAVIVRREVPLPAAIENTTDWFKILAYATSVGPDVGASVEAALTELETKAVTTAAPTPYIQDVIAACHQSGRVVAVISNNSASAVRAYLDTHDLASQVSAIAARTRPDPAILKPSPHLIKEAASALGTSQSTCAVVGDSQSDIQAAHSAGALSIGYAKTSADADDLAAAGAGAVILSLAELALQLRARAVDLEL
jgi:phosphoglycolate phosphatase